MSQAIAGCNEDQNQAYMNEFDQTVISELVAGGIIPRAVLKRVRRVLHEQRDDVLSRRRNGVVQRRRHAHLNHGSGEHTSRCTHEVMGGNKHVGPLAVLRVQISLMDLVHGLAAQMNRALKEKL